MEQISELYTPGVGDGVGKELEEEQFVTASEDGASQIFVPNPNRSPASKLVMRSQAYKV